MAYNIELKSSDWLHDVNAENFDDIALATFQHQYNNNAIYRAFTDALHIAPETVDRLTSIPFLPISFFKTHRVQSGDWGTPAFIFESSGTTGEVPSRHFVKDSAIYEYSLLRGFEEVYGPVEDYTILALLPSYLERSNASLVHMARVLMETAGSADSGFYLDEWEKLASVIKGNEARKTKTLLLGVTFALLDFAERFPMSLSGTIVMETGGMKGRREEWTRAQVHDYLRTQWSLNAVHSEYGMTELLSQAYAPAQGLFRPASTMKVLTRDINDPLDLNHQGQGCLNIIDLANIHSCSFIATDDIGNLHPDGAFEVLGRIDHSALRGCSLMHI